MKNFILNFGNRFIQFFSGIFFIFLLAEVSHGDTGCVILKKDVQAEDVENGATIPFSVGRILPFTEYDPLKKKINILYRGKEYWIPSNVTKVGPANLCSFEPKCFTTEKPSPIYSDHSLNASRIGLGIRGQKFPLAGQGRLGQMAWVQVDVGDTFGWIPADNGNVENRACPQSEDSQKRHFVFRWEMGGENNVVTQNYDQALSQVTTPSDVEYSLPDPFFTEVKPGKGYSVAALLGVDTRVRIRLEAGIGYGYYSYSLIQFNNPSNHPDTAGIPFSSLTPIETPLTETYFLLPLGIFYKWGGISRWTYRLGLRADMLFALGKKFEYSYYTGTLFKQQKSQTFSVGPPDFQNKESLEARIQYRIGLQTEVGVSYKYSTFQSHNLSLFFEY